MTPFGASRSGNTLALLGDSYAEHWLGGLERAGRAYGWRIEANVMGGCPVSDFSTLTSGAMSRRYRKCSRYREALLARIIAEKPRAVILSNFDLYLETIGSARHEFQVNEATWIEGLRRTYSRRAVAGIPVIVIRGTPRVPRGLDVRFVEMNDQICATTRCETVRNGVVMFTDDNHLTASFARSVGLVLGARVTAAVSR